MSPAIDTLPPPVGPRRHSLLVADDDHRRRESAAAWVEGALAIGEKVYYKGWHDPGMPLEKHWLAGPEGARAAPEALRSGQLELLDFGTVLHRCGGTTEGLWQYQDDEVEQALEQGYPAVAMSQETARRPMADEAEAAELARQESGYSDLMARWPLRVLCQLTTAEENDAAAWETVAVHHEDLVDGPWSSVLVEGWWQPRGEVDAYVARRFGAAAYGALRTARANGDPDLHVDLSAVGFIDVACVQMLLLAARSAPVEQRLVLHRTPRMAERLIEAVGRPETVTYGQAR